MNKEKLILKIYNTSKIIEEIRDKIVLEEKNYDDNLYKCFKYVMFNSLYKKEIYLEYIEELKFITIYKIYNINLYNLNVYDFDYLKGFNVLLQEFKCRLIEYNNIQKEKNNVHI